MRFVVSGAGGQLRSGDIRTRMNRAHIEAWAPRTHFLVVEISGDQKIKLFSVQGITSQDAIDVLNEAIKKSQELAARKLQEMTGGLGGLLGGGGPQ